MSKAQLEHGLEQAADTDLTESERHRLLADERRQVVLDVLPEQTTELSLEELTTAVLERVPTDPGEDTTSRQEVAVSLHHVHLPVLDDVGILEYDADCHLVAVQ
ncbi:DUF7344 domain-containing protein [Halobacterium wangiae]|uniref:DUF7344 domain-containing protein n=1 Tax=Halobacterium wangiae TaxID=2902623 RepID=UPI001E328C85|nr:hypothetical protein [Halobacterium wangiae]